MALRDWMMIGGLSILWGGSFPLVELALTGVPVLTIVWLRVMLAAAMLALVMAVAGQEFPARRHWPALLVMGLLNNALPFTLMAVAQGQISGALASILNATTPLATVLIAHLATTDERITRRKAIGLALGFAGVVVMLAGQSLDGATLAKMAALLAAFCYATASIWGRRFRRTGLAPMTTTFGQVAASTLMLAPVMLLVDRPWAAPMPPMMPLAAVVALALFSTALAYLLYFRILARSGATKLSLVTFLIPVSATAMGVAFLGESLLVQHGAGFALIALGLLAIGGGGIVRKL